MESIIIQADRSKLDLLEKLAKELGLSYQRVKRPILEDEALGILADRVKTGKTVSKEAIDKAIDKAFGLWADDQPEETPLDAKEYRAKLWQAERPGQAKRK